MPILNSVYKGKNLFVSEFLCPHCLVVRYYNIKPMSKEITFCSIPLLEESIPAHVIECQVCKNAFDPDVLQRNIQSMLRLAGAAKHKLDQGISPGYLKLQLVSDGLKESFADKLISLAKH